ncbi:sec-independent translocase [Peterkaempfera bronchialis]|uniref:Sec-independent protein translocase subunit TatB n=1 Tax=Peterkaempfera bronchialis TaxID=2126346 RepID=A0A345SYC4_9ACTN|nr:sec-independent translocase [Peterkaempfera bronchialis]AXI78729.1 Sec-independent protein translocase subunit TatB [Peterkaempfera bronchialis]
MFFDMGPVKLVALLTLAVVLFGPDKLPAVIQQAMELLRRIREFSDSAKEDIRSGLGPEFQDFEFEDLHPRNIVRKQLQGGDDLGLKEFRDLRDLLDPLHPLDPPDPLDPLHPPDRPAERGPAARGGPPPFDPEAT